MGKQLVLIDFDHTLLDFSHLKPGLNTYESQKEVLLSQEDLDTWLYADVKSLLDYISEKYTPGIFSEGEPSFQQQKISKTFLPSYIKPEHIFVFEPHHKMEHLHEILDKHQVMALIDDSPVVVDKAKKAVMPIIRVLRGKYAQQQSAFRPSFEVKSLQEIVDKDLLGIINDPLSQSKNVHMVGIKGVGMTGLAQLLVDKGLRVTGSDTPEPQITDETLEKLTIKVNSFGSENLSKSTDLVIYSGAYKQTHSELRQAFERQIYTLTLAEAVQAAVSNKSLIAICGVGGKTTTTAMLGTIFYSASDDYGWLTGVSHINQGKIPSAHLGTGQFFALEADEYAIAPTVINKPKFSLYNPQIIICTNLAYDHPDIYPNFESTLKTFAEFFNRLPSDGLLIIKPDDYQQIKPYLSPTIKFVTYGTDSSADWKLEPTDSPMIYLVSSSTDQARLELSVLGQMNGLNALGAFIASYHIGLPEKTIVEGLKHFTGTKRRLEKIAERNASLYYDDYAHHPHEVRAVLAALKQAYPNHRLRVVFHPHTLTRTKALLKDFSQAFTQADEVIIATIFTSAREQDDGSITSQDLAEAISVHNPHVQAKPNFEKIITYLKESNRNKDLILTLGAGDIYKIHAQLV